MDERPAVLSSAPGTTSVASGLQSPTGAPTSNGAPPTPWTATSAPHAPTTSAYVAGTSAQAHSGVANVAQSSPVSSTTPSPPPTVDTIFREYLYRNCRDSLFWLEVGTISSLESGSLILMAMNASHYPHRLNCPVLTLDLITFGCLIDLKSVIA